VIDNEWRLSAGVDLLPSPRFSGQHNHDGPVKLRNSELAGLGPVSINISASSGLIHSFLALSDMILRLVKIDYDLFVTFFQK
jgi:hypothetical protein